MTLSEVKGLPVVVLIPCLTSFCLAKSVEKRREKEEEDEAQERREERRGSGGGEDKFQRRSN